MRLNTDSHRIAVFERLSQVRDEVAENIEEYLGDFALCSIPRVGDLLKIAAYGSSYGDGIPYNIYAVEAVMHNPSHLAWDTMIEKLNDMGKGPKVTIFVKYISSQQMVDGGRWMRTSKGRLRRSEMNAQQYWYDQP